MRIKINQFSSDFLIYLNQITELPRNFHTGNITLSKTGLAGITAVWEPDNVITGGSGTRTLKLTATAGNWTDGAAGEEGTFGVTGVGGIHTHTANGEVVI